MTGTRSTGCNTCRSRKVKCDETRPICKRCLKANIQCLGYQKPIKFVDESLRLAKQDNLPHQQAFSWIQTNKQQASNTKSLVKPEPTVLGLAKELSLSAFKDNIFISFLLTKLFDGSNRFSSNGWWAVEAVRWKTSSLSLRALASMLFGRAHAQPSIIMRGLRHYSEALASLRDDLLNSDGRKFSALAATSSLSMYELISLDSPKDGWIQHAGGLASLMEARGPHSFKEGPDRAIFLENRILIISNAIKLQRRTFLGETKWKQVPWEDNPHLKSSFHILCDSLCDLAGILEDSNMYCAGSEEPSLLSLGSRVSRSLENLDAYFRMWATKNLHNIHAHTPVHAFFNDAEGQVFETMLDFDTFWTCYITILYNGARILLLQARQKLIDSSRPILDLTPLVDEENPTALLGVTSDIQGLALEIIRTSEFCIDDKSKTQRFLGTFCLLWPIGAAFMCFDPASRVGRWLRGSAQYFKQPSISDPDAPEAEIRHHSCRSYAADQFAKGHS